MAAPDRSDLPRGFGGAVQCWHDLVADEAALRLPRDAEVDGPLLRVPDGARDTIVVESLAEGLGSVERLLVDLARRLAPGGRLLVDALCAQSPRQLRIVLEGRPNSLDPVGSLRLPELAVGARRLVDAAAGAGLLVEDVFALPHPDRFDPGFARALIEQGMMATAYAGRVPPARLWLVAAKQPRAAGTVLIGAGDDAAQERTRACVAAYLPGDWEVVFCGPGGPEHVAFNRGIASSRGDSVWLLRAGAVPGQTAFAALADRVVLGPCAPGDGGDLERPGDVAGLMIARRDLLCAGPIGESWASPSVAYEDWGMHLDAVGLRVEAVGPPIASPPAEAGAAAVLERESARLLARWSGVGPSGGAEPVPVPAAPPPWHGRRPRVSMCMITRDEERFLDECLRRAAPAVDEIVVVDTGSTDRTIEIARAHGATVVEEVWSDDFARHRDSSLAAATGDWILVLDADEFLEPGSAEEIRRAVEDPRVCGYHVLFTNVYGPQKTLGVTMVRLFRNLPGIRWINRIHEQITPSLLEQGRERGLVLANAAVHVMHHGYSDEVMAARGKLERNERLFEMQLAEHPDDVYSLYKYGDFLRRVQGRDDDARRVLERTLALIFENHAGCPRGLPYAGEVAALCALEQARRENWARAEEIIELALRRFMVTPNLHYIAAGIALHRGREDEAIAHYRECLRYRGQTLVVPIQDGITGHVSLTGMAQAFLQKGDRATARRLLEQAIALDPSHDVTAMVLSRLWLEEGDPRRSMQVLADYLCDNPNSAGACQQLTMLLAQLGYHDQARRVGERAIQLLESSASGIEANHVRQALAALG